MRLRPLLLSLLGAGWGWLRADTALREQLDLVLAGEAEGLIRDYQAIGPAALLDAARISARQGGPLLILVQTADGQTLAGRLNGAPAALLGYTTLQPANGPRLRALGALLPGGINLVVAAQLAGAENAARALASTPLLAALGAGGLALLLGFVAARALERRLASISDVAQQVTAGDLSRRLPLSARGDEFDRLVATVNAMLGKLESLVAAQRQVTDDIAHDLRGPLQRLRQTLEGALPAASEPAVLHAAIAELDGVADTSADLEARLAAVIDVLKRDGRTGGRRGFTVAREAAANPIAPESELARAFGASTQASQRIAEDGDESYGDGVRLAPPEAVDAVTRIWGMRKKAVGLLGNMKGDARPIPFVEDTAVPPENLADYIGEFRAVLDRRGLVYGMFGHVDAGVLHVRPAIDMKAPGAEALIRDVTEEVVALTRKYGGLLWGEHGKGVRSEFVPTMFGPLYPALQRIKLAFDPRDQMNPGKIAAPAARALMRVDGVPTRGGLDRTIPAPVRASFDEALHCNGNGACFTYDPDEAMCPSWKATRERRHSPKGRASLMREWLRLAAAAGVDPAAELRKQRAGWLRDVIASLRPSRRDPGDFSHAVKDAMDGCLACKSCTGSCPVKVDVPTFRAKFLALYHQRYRRPWKDHVVAALEPALPLAARMPVLGNLLLENALAQALMTRLGLVEIPRLSCFDLADALAQLGVATATPEALRDIGPAERGRSVVVVQDAFTTHFEAELVADLCALLVELGFRPWLAPYRPNGKPLHVHGFLARFARTARESAAGLQVLAETGVALVGLDPSMTLTYRSEYAGVLPPAEVPRVYLVQEWLVANLDAVAPRQGGATLRLLPHCTERTNAPSAIKDWQALFAHLGLRLEVVASGCCGMAGTYGHEARNRASSKVIYGQSWAHHIAGATDNALLADGYSCRSQVKLIDGVRLRHPIQALLAHVARS